MDSAILGTIHVNKLHGKSIIHICDLIKYKMRWDTMPKATWHTPSSFETGRHSQWWSSTLHLMHLWAQLHRQSLSGICASKSGSCWMNLSSCWTTTVLASAPTASISTYSCLLKSIQLQCGSKLCMCWHNTIIVAITVIVIVKWHCCLDAFNGITTLIVTLGVMLGIFSCVTRTTQISSCTKLLPEVLCTFRHQLCVERDFTAAFHPHQG